MRFKDILGHEKETGLLKKAILKERVAHAYIFSGPSGIGKKLAARTFAQALNCEDFTKNSDCCGECGSCRDVENGASTNILSVLPEKGVLKIDRIRELQKILRYKPEKGRRVAIVEGADLMVRAVETVFLKTLEEPPAGAVIILLTSRPDNLLPTTLSRCQRVNFRPIKEETISGVLKTRYPVSDREAAVVSRLSGGNLSMALKFLDSGLLEKRKKFFERFKMLKSHDTIEILDFAAELSKDDDIEDVLDFLKSFYRDILCAGAGRREFIVNSDIEEMVLSAGGAKGAKGAGGAMGGDINRVIDSFGFIEEARRSIMPPRYANKVLAMEALLIRLLA